MNEEQVTNTTPSKNSGLVFSEILKFTLIVAIIVIPFRLFVAQPYIVEGSSMDPTFKNGDYLIVDQLSMHFTEPERGNVIIMRYPLDTSKFFIKRVIGLPGETVVIKSGKVSIQKPDSTELQELSEDYITYESNDNLTVSLKENEYFVLGDNRAGSSDSRVWGPLPENDIVGKPILRLLPIKHVGLFPGKPANQLTP